MNCFISIQILRLDTLNTSKITNYTYWFAPRFWEPRCGNKNSYISFELIAYYNIRIEVLHEMYKNFEERMNYKEFEWIFFSMIRRFMLDFLCNFLSILFHHYLKEASSLRKQN